MRWSSRSVARRQERSHDHTRIFRTPAEQRSRATIAAGSVRNKGLPGPGEGPTPRVDLASWRFTINDGPRMLASWSWPEFETLPQTTWRGDIHCVTKWSKLDTLWRGITIDDLLMRRNHPAPRLPARAIARRLRHQRSRRGFGQRKGDDRDALCRCADRGRAWRSGKAARAAPLFLEEREVDQRACDSPRVTRRASGSSAAITCTAIPGASSAIRTTRDDRRRDPRDIALAGSGDRADRASDAARHQRLPPRPAGCVRGGTARRRPA